MSERPRYDHPTVFNYLQDYGVDLRARRIFIHRPIELSDDSHEIGTEFAVRNLLHLDKSSGEIELWINSPGGDLSEMWGLYDIIRSCENPVNTVAFGTVASAACLLLAAGTGTRYAMPHARMLWHAGTTGIDQMHWPDAHDRMKAEAEETKAWISEMAHRTKPRVAGKLLKTVKEREAFWATNARGGGELWMTARQLVQHGVVDEIWE